jgi:hypothetical protein
MQNHPPRPMKHAIFALSFGFAALILATQNAHGQPAPQSIPQANANADQCGPRAAVLAALENSYGEGRRGIGMAGAQTVVEIFANSQTGTWTVIATRPDGVTCLLASGTDFEALTPPAPARGSPA